MEIVNNRNGYQYAVIEKQGVKTLFKNLKNGEYVVGSHAKKYEDGIEWCFGHYFNNLQSAVEYLYK